MCVCVCVCVWRWGTLLYPYPNFLENVHTVLVLILYQILILVSMQHKSLYSWSS